MPERVCIVEDCERPHVAKGYCKLHYERVRAFGSTDKPKPKPKRATGKGTGWMATRVSRRSETSRLPREVTADYSYPDRHPEAPGGQRIAVFTCPVCEGPHLVAWRPFEEHPGWKSATCRIATAAGGKVPQFYVLAPPTNRQYDRQPVDVSLRAAS